MIKLRHTIAAAAVIAAALFASTSFAATTLDPNNAPVGISYSGSYSLPGDTNCPVDAPDCIKLAAQSGTFTITADVGYTFTLTSFAFSFDGQGGNGLEVSYAPGSPGSFSLMEADYPKGTVYTFDTSPLPLANLTSLTFADLGGGTSLVGAIKVNDLSQVPLPATGLLLFGAVGVLGAMRRRKAA